jgi:type I restriction enzyme R subunit
VLLDPYETYIKKALNWVNRLKNIAPTIQSVDDLEVSADKREFIESFRGLTRILTTLRNFLEFEFSESLIGISEQEYADYKSKYLDLSRDPQDKEKVSVLADVDFEIELLARDKVDVDYILNLLSNIDFENEKRREKDIDRIRKILDQSDTKDLHSKIELLRKFIETVLPTLTKEDVIEEEYNEFLDKEIDEKICYVSQETDVEPMKIKEFMAEYQYSNTMPHQYIRDNVGGKFIEKKKRVEKIREFLEEVYSLY